MGGGHLLGSLKNPTTGLIWLVTRGGGMGEGVGRWPMEGGQNNWSDLAGDEVGGGTREQCGSNKRCTVFFFWRGWAPLKFGW